MNTENRIQQENADSCAIKSQQIILNEFGVPVTEEELLNYSSSHGWYQQGEGINFDDVGKLLESANIPCTQTENANIFDLASQLAQGHKVIVGVDNNELRDGGVIEWLKDSYFGETPDHVLIVAGLDLTDPDYPKVIVTDSGVGDNSKEYPLDQFLDAWHDSQYYMVSTDIPSPDASNTFSKFNDHMTYHLPTVNGSDYDVLNQFRGYSHYNPDDKTFNYNETTQDSEEMNKLYELFSNFDSPSTTTFNSIMAQTHIPLMDMSLYTPLTPNDMILNPDSVYDDQQPTFDNDTALQDYIDTSQQLYNDMIQQAHQASIDGFDLESSNCLLEANDILHDVHSMGGDLDT